MAEDWPEFGSADVPPRVPRRGNAFSRWLGRTLLRLIGWRILGCLPDAEKIVVVGAPHTSNFDAFIGFCGMQMLGVRLSVMIKDNAFKGPWAGLFRWLGAVPIDRSHSGGTVAQTIATYQQTAKILTVIMPEGTRKAAPKWKSGFYHVAVQAGAAMVPAVLDYDARTLTLKPPFVPSGDFEADLPRLLENFAGAVPRNWQRLSQPMAKLLGRTWQPQQRG